MLFGANWYLKYVAQVHLSSSGEQLGTTGDLPLPAAPLEMATPYAYRYALNQNVDGYTMPYWDWGYPLSWSMFGRRPVEWTGVRR